MLKTVSSITNAIGALNYKGTWNASTNSPTLASGVGTKGDYYVVSVAGSTNLDGETLWGVGDWAVYNGSAWQKVEGGNTINATTVSASTSVTTPVIQATSSAGGTLKNNGGTAQLQWGSGGGSNLSLEVATNINPANAAVAISPTGTGTVAISPAGALTINPTTASTMNNVAIGGSTPLAITGTTITATGAGTFGSTSTTKLDNATTFPVIRTSNRTGSGSNHTIGAVLFDGFRDTSDPSYLGGMWIKTTNPSYQDLTVMFFGCENSGGTGLPTAAIALTNNSVGRGFYPVADNAMPLGLGGNRWSVVYAGNGTINTSDANEKTDIADLDEAEKKVAVRLKSLIKKFKFKDSVAEKGEAARIHVGAIAQEVAAAFVAEGLDPTKYGVFCSDTFRTYNGNTVSVDNDNNYVETHIELNGVKIEVPAGDELPEGAKVVDVKHPTEEKTRLGLRYDQLFAFIISTL
jgi:hypothetical protein